MRSGAGKPAAGSHAVKVTGARYTSVSTRTATFSYTVKCLWSLLKIETVNTLKGIPLWVVLAGWLGFFGIETFSDLDGTTRLPEQLATTTVMIKSITSGFSLTALLVLLFYANESFWRSRSYGFDQLEDTTAVHPMVVLIAKWLALTLLICLMLAASIAAGIGIQLGKGYTEIDLYLYASLFYLQALPLALNAGLIVSILVLVKNRYIGIAVAGIVILLLNTSMGDLLLVNHPLLKFSNTYTWEYSELNGFGRDLIAFHYKMIYGLGLTGVIFVLSVKLRYKYNRYLLPHAGPVILMVLLFCHIFLGGEVFFIIEQGRKQAGHK